MTRQEARERLKGTFIFEQRGDKVLLRDLALIQAVEAYEQAAKPAQMPFHLAAAAPAPFRG